MDLNVTEKLTDDQLDKRIAQLATNAKRRGDTAVIDAIFTVAPREVIFDGGSTGAGAPAESEQNLDLL